MNNLRLFMDNKTMNNLRSFINDMIFGDNSSTNGVMVSQIMCALIFVPVLGPYITVSWLLIPIIYFGGLHGSILAKNKKVPTAPRWNGIYDQINQLTDTNSKHFTVRFKCRGRPYKDLNNDRYILQLGEFQAELTKEVLISSPDNVDYLGMCLVDESDTSDDPITTYVILGTRVNPSCEEVVIDVMNEREYRTNGGG